MKKKEDEPKKGAPPYMNTYGDMMTLLLCFFVLLFSMSTIDAQKFQQLISSLHAQVSIFDGGQTINNTTTALQNGMTQMPVKETTFSIQDVMQQEESLKETQEALSSYVEQQNIQDSVIVEREGNQVVIRFKDGVLFDSGKAQIKAGAIPTLSALGEQIKKYMAQGYTIGLEGHTDNQPISNSQFPSNWELSSARAIAVMRFYTEQMDIDGSNVSCVGWGEYHPIVSNDTKEGRAMNRRVEIKLGLSTTP